MRKEGGAERTRSNVHFLHIATTNQAERDGIYKRCAVLMPILDIRRTEAVRMDVTIAQGRTKESEQ